MNQLVNQTQNHDGECRSDHLVDRPIERIGRNPKQAQNQDIQLGKQPAKQQTKQQAKQPQDIVSSQVIPIESLGERVNELEEATSCFSVDIELKRTKVNACGVCRRYIAASV